MNRDRHNLNSAQSVTVLITRRPHKSNQKEFEQALSDTMDAALEFPGHLGVTVLKPQGDNKDYQIIVKFASQDGHIVTIGASGIGKTPKFKAIASSVFLELLSTGL